MQYSVLVAATGDGPALQKTLALVHAQMQDAALLDPERTGELVAVLNQPRESFGAIERASLERWVDRIHFDSERNKARGLNSAIAAARGEWIFFTEEEALPQPGWLTGHLDALTRGEHPWCGSGGPILPVFSTGGPPPWIRKILATSESTPLGPAHRLLGNPQEYVLSDGLGPAPFGLNSVFRRDILQAAPLPEDLVPHAGVGLRTGEDTALAVHLLSIGERIHYQASAGVHVEVPPRRFARAYAEQLYTLEGRGRGRAIEAGLVRTHAQAAAARTARWRPLAGDSRPKPMRELQALTRGAMLSMWAKT